jgi:hypothetical protein
MQPSEDERVLAALSHASIVANVANLAGLIATSLIWSTQRERSAYVRAHALQAMIYQGGVLVISIFLVLFWGVCVALSLLPAAVRPDLYRSSPPYSFWLALASLVVPVGFGIAATLYGLYVVRRVSSVSRPAISLPAGRAACARPFEPGQRGASHGGCHAPIHPHYVGRAKSCALTRRAACAKHRRGHTNRNGAARRGRGRASEPGVRASASAARRRARTVGGRRILGFINE